MVFGLASVMRRRDKGIWTTDPSNPFGLIVSALKPHVTDCFPAQDGGIQSAFPSTRAAVAVINLRVGSIPVSLTVRVSARDVLDDSADRLATWESTASSKSPFGP